jgi:hypothetical protein
MSSPWKIAPILIAAIFASQTASFEAFANADTEKSTNVNVSDDHSYLPPGMQQQPANSGNSRGVKEAAIPTGDATQKKGRQYYASAKPRRTHYRSRDDVEYRGPRGGFPLFGLMFGGN